MGPFHPARHSTRLHVTTFVTLVAFLSACHSWSVVPLKTLETSQPEELQPRIRVTPRDGGWPVELAVQKIDYPFVTGVVTEEPGADQSRDGLVMDAPQPTSRRVVTVDLREASEVEETKPRIRVTPQDGGRPVELDVQQLDYPRVTGVTTEEVGIDQSRGGLVLDAPKLTIERVVTLDLREAGEVEVRSASQGRTALAVLGATVAILSVVMLIALASKSSCPFVYVDDGTGYRFVGEVYSGATIRAMQRDDLLPLPSIGARPKLRLSNEAHETQFTDLLEVVVVDRAPGRRALATHDARVILVGDGRAPRAATDLDGNDVLDLLRDADGRSWRTDLDAAARRPDPPIREGLVVTFSVPGDRTALALQLDVANTPWLDVVAGRHFAAMGETLDDYHAEGERPEGRGPAIAWRDREGVNLRVEVERGGRWEHVAMVPTIGPASQRRVAVPIGSPVGGEVRVRLSGGVGFWEVDAAALAAIAPDVPAERRFAPVRAVERDGTDVRKPLARADGIYQVLRDAGQRVELAFEVPPAPPGLERDSFLRTSGYYQVHRPPQSRHLPGTLQRLDDEPGSLSRFSVDLYREYLKATAGPVAAAP